MNTTEALAVLIRYRPPVHGREEFDEALATVSLRLTKKGRPRGGAILTEDQVRDIRVRVARGETHRGIAKLYGVATCTISGIAIGRSWRST